MDRTRLYVNTGMVILAFLFMASFTAVADDDHKQKNGYGKIADHDDDDAGRHERKRNRRRNGSHGGSSVKAVTNKAYQDACGECHFAYPPELMPAASWTALIKSLADHFGETIELDDNSATTITDYLIANSAENSRTKHGTKIMKSLENRVPERITQIPYMVHKHQKIAPDVFNRESIGSFSNCGACHTTAGEGIWDDDNVTIPR